MSVGEKIYTLRTRAGYSQEEFAELIGVSRQSVSKWETSSVMPDTEYIVKICKVLSVSTDTLLLDNELPVETETTDCNETQQSSETEPTSQVQRDEVTAQHDSNKKLSIVGFVLSFFFSIVGLIISSIAVSRDRRSSNINHLAVSGVAISCAKIFVTIIFVVVFGTLNSVYGGIL